jgi:hypothetical protein
LFIKLKKKHSNADGLSRWALSNTPDNPACDPGDEDIFPILGIHVCDLDEAYYSLIHQGRGGGTPQGVP